MMEDRERAKAIVKAHDPDSFMADMTLRLSIADALGDVVYLERQRCLKIAGTTKWRLEKRLKMIGRGEEVDVAV